MPRSRGGHASATYEEATGAIPNASRLIVVISCVAAIGAMVHGLLQGQGTPASTQTLAPASASPAPAGLSPGATSPVPAASQATSAAAPALPPPYVGIVAGHSGHDSGAVCPDGLTEVEINLDVAGRVVHVLQAMGYQVDLLEEYDPRLDGYQADALVSIHADSCVDYLNATPPATGFKVASVDVSAVPQAEARLVTCLAQAYAARTGMAFHANSITYDMTRYHVFSEIADQTPAAIIETGFMYRDRDTLTGRADLVARGIVDGIACFVQGEAE